MSSGPKKSFAQFPPDFRLPGLAKQETARQADNRKAGAAPASAANSTYYRQGVLVPGGLPARPVSRNRAR